MASNVVPVTLDELPGAIDRGEERIRRAITYGAIAGAHRGRAMMVARTPTDMGQLRASWKVREHALNTDGSGPLAELINDAPHIAVVELGARPHKISAEGWAALYEWVRRHFRKSGGKGSQYRLGSGGRMKPRGAGSDVGPFKGSDPEISAITNAIAFKIRKYGQRATLFVRNSVDELRAVMAFELERAIAQAQREMKRDGGL